MKLLSSLAAVALITLSVPSHAQKAGRLELVYSQPLEGVYGQNWFAQVLGNRNGQGVEVYVVGEGKIGDFFGVISVDCQTPKYSRWLSTGGYVSSEDIPRQTVSGIRQSACGK